MRSRPLFSCYTVNSAVTRYEVLTNLSKFDTNHPPINCVHFVDCSRRMWAQQPLKIVKLCNICAGGRFVVISASGSVLEKNTVVGKERGEIRV